MTEEILRFVYRNGVRSVFPCHPLVKSWMFADGDEKQATLAHALAVVAESNGIDGNDLRHLFPAILRMLKDRCEWSGLKVENTEPTSVQNADIEG